MTVEKQKQKATVTVLVTMEIDVGISFTPGRSAVDQVADVAVSSAKEDLSKMSRAVASKVRIKKVEAQKVATWVGAHAEAYAGGPSRG